MASNIGQTGSVGPYYYVAQASTYPPADTWDAIGSNPIWQDIIRRAPDSQEGLWKNFLQYGPKEFNNIEEFLQAFFYALEGYTTPISRIRELWVGPIEAKYAENLDLRLADWGVQLGDAQKSLFFDQAFNSFVKKFYNGEISGVTNLETFFNAFDAYCAKEFMPDQEIYDAALAYLRTLFPDESQEALMPQLQALFAKYLKASDDGRIDGDAFLQEWTKLVATEYLKSIGYISGDVDHIDYAKIIMDVYELLRELLGVMQKTQAAQIDFVRVLVKMEMAYNKAIAAVPNTTTLDLGTSDAAKSVLADAQMSEQKWMQSFQGFLSMIQDQIKEAQTSQSSSGESVNQAGNILSMIYQMIQGVSNQVNR